MLAPRENKDDDDDEDDDDDDDVAVVAPGEKIIYRASC